MPHLDASVQSNAALIKRHLKDRPLLLGAIILGSGLSAFSEQLQDRYSLPYNELQGFPQMSVEGHIGELAIGTLGSGSLLCFRGRQHYYEGHSLDGLKILIRTVKLVGVPELLITNAAGSLRPDVGPGSLVMVNDHINFQGSNPLVGPNADSYGPRFVSLDAVYDLDIRQRMQRAAQQEGIGLSEGVYLSTLGPVFETPAEIRAFRLLGADLVGMSTVPDVLIARHAGLRVGALSVVTNFAAGMSPEALSHEGTLFWARESFEKFQRLVTRYYSECLFSDGG